MRFLYNVTDGSLSAVNESVEKFNTDIGRTVLAIDEDVTDNPLYTKGIWVILGCGDLSIFWRDLETRLEDNIKDIHEDFEKFKN